ncbi:YdcF family protein [Mucilaginibacter sp.]|uniref:YdcF family protein n=1 Tax=Mucilaginibacter sp. TaxID=1882438 RepID=UPI003D146B18
MFFIFSKVLLIFILPFTWIVAFFIAGLVIKNTRLKHRCLIISAILLLIFSNPFILNVFARNWDIYPVPLKASQYSCAIVLGGFAGEDANGKGFFNTSADRFIQGLKLLQTGKVSHLLISGGNGTFYPDNFAESDWVYGQLRAMHIPDSCIVVENKSRNTLENAAFSKVILEKKHLAGPYLLVTSGFHMRRSLGIFKRAQMDVTPYPCNYFAGNGKFAITQFIPDAAPLELWNMYTKEIVGEIVNHLR